MARTGVLALGITLVVVLAGCGSSAPAETRRTAATRAPSTARPSAARPSAAAPSATPVRRHEAPDLEALLPATFNGVAFLRESLQGEHLLAQDKGSAAIRSFLSLQGKSAGDIAGAYALDTNGDVDVRFYVFRVVGVDANLLATAISDSARATSPGLKLGPASVGGKAVTVGVLNSEIQYIYVHGGAVFGVSSLTQALADQGLAALP